MLITRVDFYTAAVDLDYSNGIAMIDTSSGALAATLPAPTNPGAIVGVCNTGAVGNNVTVTSRGVPPPSP